MTAKTNKLPSVLLDENIARKEWKIVENVELSEFEVSNLELVSCLKKDEDEVGGEEMRRRAVRLGANLGLDDAKYILDHQAEIPPKFRGKFLLFPGTLFDTYHIVCLIWKDGEWLPAFLQAGFDEIKFDEKDMLVRYKYAGRAQA